MNLPLNGAPQARVHKPRGPYDSTELFGFEVEANSRPGSPPRVFVLSVTAGSAAEKSGLVRSGDELLEVNKVPVGQPDAFSAVSPQAMLLRLCPGKGVDPASRLAEICSASSAGASPQALIGGQCGLVVFELGSGKDGEDVPLTYHFCNPPVVGDAVQNADGARDGRPAVGAPTELVTDLRGAFLTLYVHSERAFTRDQPKCCRFCVDGELVNALFLQISPSHVAVLAAAQSIASESRLQCAAHRLYGLLECLHGSLEAAFTSSECKARVDAHMRAFFTELHNLSENSTAVAARMHSAVDDLIARDVARDARATQHWSSGLGPTRNSRTKGSGHGLAVSGLADDERAHAMSSGFDGVFDGISISLQVIFRCLDVGVTGSSCLNVSAHGLCQSCHSNTVSFNDCLRIP